jgi:hypothetical protein
MQGEIHQNALTIKRTSGRTPHLYIPKMDPAQCTITDARQSQSCKQYVSNMWGDGTITRVIQDNRSTDGQSNTDEGHQGNNGEDLQGSSSNGAQNGMDESDQSGDNGGLFTSIMNRNGLSEELLNQTTGAGRIGHQQGPSGEPPTSLSRRIEEDAPPSPPPPPPPPPPPHSSDARREQSTPIPSPEQLKRHHSGTDDTSNHSGEEDTQDSPGTQKRQRLEQGGEPSEVAAPKPPQLESSKGGKGGKGGSRGGRGNGGGGGKKMKKASTQPVSGSSARRSTRNSGTACEFLLNLFLLPSVAHCFHLRQLDWMCTIRKHHQGLLHSTLGVDCHVSAISQIYNPNIT